MIHVQGKIPRDVYVAISGGVDSIAIAHFLSRNHNLVLVHVNHSEGNSNESEELVRKFAKSVRSNLYVEKLKPGIPAGLSKEEHWRNERLRIFHNLNGEIVTGHNLNDCVETWVWSCLHGEGKIIPYRNKNIIRPFRLTKKSVLIEYANKHKLKWIEDESNKDLNLARNYIRNELMPKALVVNPGLEKVIFKKVKSDFGLDITE